MLNFRNKTYKQVNGQTYTAPKQVVESIYAQGGFISSGNSGKCMTVNKYENGKVVYCGTLKSYVKESSKGYRTSDTRNVTLGNLK